MKNSMKILAALLVGGMITLNACKDDDPAPLDLATVTANDIDLNGASSPNNIPIDPTLTITFSTNVDATTATNSNITITRDYDKAVIPATVTSTGAIVTVKPNASLNPGALFVLSIGAGVTSNEGIAFTPLTRNFTTLGTFAPDGAKAYWTFEDNANDVISTFDPTANGIVAITYGASHNSSAGKAAVFNGTTSIIEIANGDKLMDTNDFTLSFWVKANHATAGDTRGHFILGLGAYYGFQMELPGDYSAIQMPVQFKHSDGTTGTGGNLSFDGKGIQADTWQGVETRKDLTGTGGVAGKMKNQWAHMVYVYNSSTKQRQLYINGELMESENYNLWPADAIERTSTGLKYAGVTPDVVNELAFGFVQSRAGTMWDDEDWGGYAKASANHFEGSLDDIIVYNKVITASEILLMYNSGK